MSASSLVKLGVKPYPSSPQYAEPLLQEITEVTSRFGWTKEAIGAMPKLDSFLKECMRVTPFETREYDLHVMNV